MASGNKLDYDLAYDDKVSHIDVTTDHDFGLLEAQGPKQSIESKIYTRLPSSTRAELEGPSFRLLRIRPGKFRQPILADLVTRPVFDAGVKWSALSYSWGIECAKAQIFIGLRCISLPVSIHLWQALNRLRHSVRPTYVWVDAICINQEDLDERSSQVSIMAQMYNQASQVIIWLGESESLQQSPPADSQAFAELCTVPRPYWTRLWVVQECAYAQSCPQVLIGGLLFPMRDLLDRWDKASKQKTRKSLRDKTPESKVPDLLSEGLARMRELYQMWLIQDFTGNHRMSLLHRWRQTLDRDCKLPHDRIYALLNMVPEHLSANLAPDYRMSLEELGERVIPLIMADDDSNTNDLISILYKMGLIRSGGECRPVIGDKKSEKLSQRVESLSQVTVKTMLERRNWRLDEIETSLVMLRGSKVTRVDAALSANRSSNKALCYESFSNGHSPLSLLPDSKISWYAESISLHISPGRIYSELIIYEVEDTKLGDPNAMVERLHGHVRGLGFSREVSATQLSAHLRQAVQEYLRRTRLQDDDLYRSACEDHFFRLEYERYGEHYTKFRRALVARQERYSGKGASAAKEVKVYERPGRILITENGVVAMCFPFDDYRLQGRMDSLLCLPGADVGYIVRSSENENGIALVGICIVGSKGLSEAVVSGRSIRVPGVEAEIPPGATVNPNPLRVTLPRKVHQLHSEQYDPAMYSVAKELYQSYLRGVWIRSTPDYTFENP